MSEETTYYLIEQLYTDGWSLATPSSYHLTKEQGTVIINDLIADGVNPKHLRAVVDTNAY